MVSSGVSGRWGGPDKVVAGYLGGGLSENYVRILGVILGLDQVQQQPVAC